MSQKASIVVACPRRHEAEVKYAEYVEQYRDQIVRRSKRTLRIELNDKIVRLVTPAMTLGVDGMRVDQVIVMTGVRDTSDGVYLVDLLNRLQHKGYLR